MSLRSASPASRLTVTVSLTFMRFTKCAAICILTFLSDDPAMSVMYRMFAVLRVHEVWNLRSSRNIAERAASLSSADCTAASPPSSIPISLSLAARMLPSSSPLNFSLTSRARRSVLSEYFPVTLHAYPEAFSLKLSVHVSSSTARAEFRTAIVIRSVLPVSSNSFSSTS